ncbi:MULTISPECIES: c-type cytochrome [Burkholderia]|uniref:c-type cytochrome n=1 Tax=Burkholderia TaxID=32008 RepID=UPI00068BA44D|nr:MULTISPECIES: c-type cytochrome [Burkholderia]AYQ86587.1 cytochrome [Burkholderia gladioli]KVM63979.1 cytochrome [Burkholderia gladioli]NBI47751.1 c-type cytochrome [Burkholderia sp. ISTR5]
MIRIRRSAASGISGASSRRLAPALLALACLGAAGGAQAVGNPAQGQARFGACVACHGANGSLPTSPAFPKIGGQNAAYLAAALHAYKSGQRNGGTAQMMQPMARGLSDQDIDDLAAYIATLGPK